MPEMTLEHLHPCRGEHAIREASLTVFLGRKLSNFNTYEPLLNDQFKDMFKHFEVMKGKKYKFSRESVTEEKEEEVGFKFADFNEGKAEKVLQAINEDTRQYYSYHELAYNRWINFISDVEKCFKVLKSVNDDDEVLAFSLHYIDQFDWKSNENIPIKKIFNEGKYLADNLLESSNAIDTVMIKRSKLDNDNEFVERIQVSAAPNPLLNSESTVVLSHNFTEIFSNNDKKNLSLTDSLEFKERITNAHEKNKDFLKTILKEEVLKKIPIFYETI